MRAYIIKYALAKGIFVTDDAVIGPYDDCITVHGKLYCKGDWMQDEHTAKERVGQLKTLKLKNLQKRIERLEETNCARMRDYSQLRV